MPISSRTRCPIMPLWLVAAVAATAASWAGAQEPGTAEEATTQSVEPTTEPTEPAAETPVAEPAEPIASETILEDPQPATVETIPVETVPEATTAGDATQLDEIVVTATRRSKTLREIAGSVDAIRGDQLEAMGAQDMEDFLKLVPGVALNKQDDSRGAPAIRGVGSDTRLVITQGTVGVYVDDMPLTDPYLPGLSPDLNPYDLERVEVLKGPQGTLFGSSSLGGAIRYITNKPELGRWEAKATAAQTEVTDGGQDAYGAAAFNIPLFGDEAALRVVGVRQNTPGFVDDFSEGKGIVDSNAKEQELYRASARWMPLALPLEIGVTWLDQRTRALEAAFADQDVERERHDTPGDQHSDARISFANLSAKYDLGWATLNSSTSKAAKTLDWLTDLARAFGAGDQDDQKFPGPTFADSDNISQELRLISPDGSESPWEWMAGLWYLKQKQFFFLSIPTASPSPVPTPDQSDLFNEYTNSVGTEQAVYGEVSRRLGERWEATLGGRYYNTTLHAVSETNGLLVTAVTGMTEAHSDFEIDEKGFNPKASIAFEVAKNLSTYALVSKGFRFGGVQVLADSSVPPNYKSDSLWNYEVGARSDWFDRRLTADLTLFYNKWKDLQISQLTPNGLLNYVDNVGSAHTQGAELALALRPFKDGLLEGLSLTSSAAWIEALTDEPFKAGSGDVPEGTRLPSTPEFQTANVLAYQFQVGRFAPTLSATHSYVGQAYADLFYTQTMGDYTTYDAQASVAATGWALEPTLAFTVTNLTDARGVAGAVAAPSISFRDIYFIRPRTAELTLTLRFY